MVDIDMCAFLCDCDPVVGVLNQSPVTLFGFPQLLFQAGPVKSDLDGYMQLPLIDRLKDLSGRFSDLGPIKRGLVCVGGDVDHGAALCGSDGFSGLDAVHRSLQGNVHKDNIGVEGQSARDRVLSGSYRARSAHSRAPGRVRRMSIACDLFVLDDKYPLVCHCVLLRPRYYRQN